MTLFVSPRQLNQRSQFYGQLSQLTRAGITMPMALEVLVNNPPAREFREPIRQIMGQLAGGATVADAMQFLGPWVPSFDLALVRAAEHSGRLDAVFRMLSEYYKERATLIRRMISDLLYPAFLFHFGIFVFPFVLWFQGRLGGIGFFLSTFGVLAVVYSAIFFVIYACQGERGEEWRSFFERICRPVPVLGSARQALALARLTAALEALLTAGVTIVEAWEMAAAGCGSPAMLRLVKTWRPHLLSGQTPSEAIREAPGQFPEEFISLYHSGEISGKLDETLLRLHELYQEEAMRKMHLLSKWVPKAIYFCVAGMICYFIFSIYLGHIRDLQNVLDFANHP